MRPHFEQDLKEYNAVAKTERRISRKFDQELLAEDLLNLEKDIAENEQTSLGTQALVMKLQRQKQEILAELHADLRGIDDQSYTPESSLEDNPQAWNVRETKNGDFVAQQGERTFPVTLGDLVADQEWGVDYTLDRKSMPRQVQKRFALEKARKQVQDALDEQILLVSQDSGRVNAYAQEGYKDIAKDREGGHDRRIGVIAEKMVRTFLEKLSYDVPDLEFTIARADLHQDVEEKIDFLVHRKRKWRGVRVATKGKDDEGIQFTTDERNETAEKKRAALERVKPWALQREHLDDIVLVQISPDDFRSAYNAWQEAGSPPGGPDSFWDTATKEKIFRHLLQDMFTPEELDAQWQSAVQSIPEHRAAA
ncbi:MAG: hypothetical protein WCV85_04135 [Patescibacteria group bacterium]|jgi:hypothetical protein